MDARYETAKILIVDDQALNIALLERILQRAGMPNFKSVTNPCLVQDLLDTFAPDIILLDLQMPVLDGFGVMRIVKEHSGSDVFLPILVLTADSLDETRRKALTEGADDFLTKPFDHTEVTLRTRNLLRTRFLHCDLQMQNAALEEKVRERTKALEEAHMEVLERLARTTEARDDNTGEHTRRVGALAGLIAAALGLPAKEAEMIQLAAQLHDIGKTGISDDILGKPGKLTSAEYETMKMHAEIGAAILTGSSAPILKLAEEIALTHHEKWDGTGYPKGLSGQQIPLAGRIVAVTDVFDALTHERPYKAAWSIPESLQEVQRLSGHQFDPQVVDAMLRVMPQLVGPD